MCWLCSFFKHLSSVDEARRSIQNLSKKKKKIRALAGEIGLVSSWAAARVDHQGVSIHAHFMPKEGGGGAACQKKKRKQQMNLGSRC